ncbi:MAG: hypothetical protein OXG58_02585 [Gemmatimonadetes bacterium]|nr:hypothetical protein [Gemmatimonadota bacterium]MCY3943567.1 hypothetical protein [Gemmatimonadota bacterium]
MREGPPRMRSLAAQLRGEGGDSVVAVLGYGSRLFDADPNRHSAYDLVVVVDGYRRFYRALAACGRTSRSGTVLAVANWVLAPNVIAFTDADGSGELAKCVVLSRRHFDREMGARRRDHFCVGRLVQRVAVLYGRDDETVAWVHSRVRWARRDAPNWTLPFIDGPFTADDFCRRMLEVSYAGEIRPETSGRARVVHEAQRDTLRATLAPILEELAQSGALVRAGGDRYQSVRGTSTLARIRLKVYFGWSKASATLRWLKYMVTFDNWLGYLVHKVERRTGIAVQLTRIERRLPVPFLLPRTIRLLRRARGSGRPEDPGAATSAHTPGA